jgi:DNA-binding transcriptional MerR regulator
MVEKKHKRITEVPLIARGRAFNDFYNFISDEKYQTVRNLLAESKYTVSKTDESYRTVNSWSEAGLLIEAKDRENGWRKFSVIDLCWLRTIKELRKLGFSLDKISTLKDCLFNSIYAEKKDDTSLFEFFVANLHRYDVYLVVTNEGKGMLCFSQEYMATQIGLPLPTTHIIINVNKLYAEVTNNPKYNKVVNPSVILDRKQLEMVEKIMTEDVSEVKLKIKDNKVVRVSYETLINNPDNTIEHIRKLLNEGGLREITIFQEGKRGHQIKQVDKT